MNLIFCLLLLLTIIDYIISNLFSSNLLLSVYRGSSRKSYEYTSTSISFNEFGLLPQINEVSDAIERSNTIIVINLMKFNTIIVSYKKKMNILYDLNITKLLDEDILLKLEPFTLIGDSNNTQYSLFTGLINDCKYINRYINEISLNYTEKFGSRPSIRFLSNEVALHLQSFSSNPNNRPLIVQGYLISPNENHKIYLIESTGLVSEVFAGISGDGMNDGMKILIDKYNNSLSIDYTKDIIEDILRRFHNNNKVDNTNNNIHSYEIKHHIFNYI